ncbi:MAG: hypothetical protein OZ921_20115 [Sorangiineae bacterium]|nr:hypothetical protein [Sorangiineae bacterium]
METKLIVVAGLISGTILACENQDTLGKASTGADQSGVGDSGLPGPASLGVRTRHGETSSTGMVAFSLPLVGDEDALARDLQKRAQYVESDGAVTGAIARVSHGRTPAESVIELTPEVELRADTWYWLVVSVDRDVTVQDPLAPPKAGTWSTHFFTGSAPHVVGISVPVDAKAGDPVTLEFSEPVDLATLGEAARVLGDGAGGGTCVLRGAKCWNGAEPWLSNDATIAVSTRTMPAELVVRLPDAARGSTRSVGEARAFLTLDDPAGGGTLLKLEASDFARLQTSPDEALWSERLPAPATRR